MMGTFPRTAHPYFMHQTRNYYDQRANTGINFVPQQEAWIIERMGKYLKTLSPVTNFNY